MTNIETAFEKSSKLRVILELSQELARTLTPEDRLEFTGDSQYARQVAERVDPGPYIVTAESPQGELSATVHLTDEDRNVIALFALTRPTGRENQIRTLPRWDRTGLSGLG